MSIEMQERFDQEEPLRVQDDVETGKKSSKASMDRRRRKRCICAFVTVVVLIVLATIIGTAAMILNSLPRDYSNDRNATTAPPTTENSTDDNPTTVPPTTRKPMVICEYDNKRTMFKNDFPRVPSCSFKLKFRENEGLNCRRKVDSSSRVIVRSEGGPHIFQERSYEYLKLQGEVTVFLVGKADCKKLTRSEGMTQVADGQECSYVKSAHVGSRYRVNSDGWPRVPFYYPRYSRVKLDEQLSYYEECE